MNSYTAAWSSPSNIALVKYWGKRPVQLPVSPSLSFTLTEARTETRLTFHPGRENGFSLKVNGGYLRDFDEKVTTFLDRVSKELDFPEFGYLEIESANTFPHSAGIASSASGMSALALCLCSVELQLKGEEPDADSFFMKASRLARLGSGSACRSLFSPAAVWGTHLSVPGSHNEFAIGLEEQNIHQVFRDFHDAILVLDSGRKPVGSSVGHALMEDHPYLHGRLAQAEQNMTLLVKALGEGNLDAFREVVEEEALSLHALMMSSRPGFMLLKPATLEVLDKIRTFRKQSGLHPVFTLDAGPNVHILYPGEERDEIVGFIRDELLAYCEDGRWIDDRIGPGPQEIKS